jgi:dynein heavy chain, axonemal
MKSTQTDKPSTDLFLRRNNSNIRRLKVSNVKGSWSLSSTAPSSAEPKKNNTTATTTPTKKRSSAPPSSPILLSPIRSARLSPQPDIMSKTIDGSTSEYLGPFSVTDERVAYGASDTIAKNYRLHSAALTMDLMKSPEDHMDAVAAKEAAIASSTTIPPFSGKGMKHSASAPLSLIPVSPAPRGLHKMNRGPKPPTRKIDTTSWDPSGPGESFEHAKMDAIRARTVETPHPYRMKIPGPLLIKGTDEWKISETTVQAIEKYWNILSTSKNDTREPGKNRIDGIAARCEMNKKQAFKQFFDMSMAEVYYQYTAANRRIALDYKLLSPRRGGTGINPQDLIALPQWWTSAEFRCPSWRILRHTGISPDVFPLGLNTLRSYYSGIEFGASLHLSEMWHVQESKSGTTSKNGILLVDLSAPSLRKNFPLDSNSFSTACKDAMEDMRDSLREHFITKVFAYLVLTTRGMGSQIMDPENESAIEDTKTNAKQNLGPLELRLQAAMEKSSNNSKIKTGKGGAQDSHDVDAKAMKLVVRSVVFLWKKFRLMFENSLSQFVKAFESRCGNPVFKHNSSIALDVNPKDPTRLNGRASRSQILIAAVRHAAGKITGFEDALYQQGGVCVHEPIINISLAMNITSRTDGKGQIEISPSLEELCTFTDQTVEYMCRVVNLTQNDAAEAHPGHRSNSESDGEMTAVKEESNEDMNLVGNLESPMKRAFGATFTEDFVISSKNKIKAILTEEYNRTLANQTNLLSRFGSIFESSNDDAITEICEGEPEGKTPADQCRNELQKIKKMIRKLLTVKNSAVLAVENVVQGNVFAVQTTALKKQIVDRVDHLVGRLVKHVSAINHNSMKDMCNEYSSITEKLVTVPEDSDELKELQKFFNDIQPRITELNESVRNIVFLRVNFLTIERGHYLGTGDKTLFAALFSWPSEIESVQERSINIQNAEKVKREEILRNRKRFFDKELKIIDRDISKLYDMNSLEAPEIRRTVKKIKALEVSIEGAEVECADIIGQDELLQIESSDEFSIQVQSFNNKLQPFKDLWFAVNDKLEHFTTWYENPLTDLNPEEIENTADDIRRALLKVQKAFDESEQTGLSELAKTVQLECSEFLEKIHPLMTLLCTRGMKARHWAAINDITGLSIRHTPGANLEQMIQYGLHLHIEDIEETCINASKEYSLESSLDKMEEEWDGIIFGSKAYKESGTSILSSVEEIETILDDQIVRAQAMRGSRYIAPFIDRITKWEKMLATLEDLIANWLKVQATWLYLESIFSSADIQKQMPTEAKRFATVDRTWRDVMKETEEDPRVTTIGEKQGMLDRLIAANHLLELVQKGLADYLNTKRIFFPRFFFLSNDELLEILSETKDPTKVQPHLKKCFEGIQSLVFDKDMAITHMVSSEKEKVEFEYDNIKEKLIQPADTGGCVEIWLDQIQTAMRKTMAFFLDESMEAYGVETPKGGRTKWLANYPGQIVLSVTQTYWTIETTAALQDAANGNKEALQKYTDHLTGFLNDIVAMVRGEVPKIVRKTISALCVLDVHSRDTVQDLANAKISSPMDFDWLCQLRYIHIPGGESVETGSPASMKVQMINAERLYAYEYLGNSMRLVITPLTDRCYRTLMGAIHLDYGGAPAGPAGTGKTETVKDLGKAVATQTVVYNCSDTLDYQAMGKFFKGLAGTGAWCCFDEFNRITLEVLSVVAQQILTINLAKVAKLDRFDFEDENIALRRTCNVFVTMNPGYAGRQELPDNLKALMRSVAMMVPDYAQIGQIILYSMGYYQGKELAVKIVMTYKLCSEQLSNQRHYDYGMRAVIAVLLTMGNLKRKFPDVDEDILCLRGIVDVNLPKFLAPDVPLFEGITGDLFPGVKLPVVDRSKMNPVLLEHIAEAGLQPTPYFVKKVFEIYEMMCVRHGFMVVGLPYAAKTNGLKMLAKVLTTLKERDPEDNRWNKVHYQIMNPKAITMGQLYGEFDPVSREWSDGILAIGYRNFSSDPPKVGKKEDLKWVWFDGPVDAVWIENMNTVLDNNKKLCLMNGEMIMMSDSMSMIFEPMDLEVASPATVSRVGVIYMEPHRMGWRPCVTSWLQRIQQEPHDPESEVPCPTDKRTWNINKTEAGNLNDLFEWLVDPALCFVQRMCKEYAPTFDQTLVVGTCRLLEGLLESALGVKEDNKRKRKKKGEEEVKPTITQATMESSFLFALIWSIGATVNGAGRDLFSAFMHKFLEDPMICEKDKEFKGVNTQLMLRGWKYPFEGPRKFAGKIPSKNMYHEKFSLDKNKWVGWMSDIVKAEIPPDAAFSSILVSTEVSEQLEYIMGILTLEEHPILLVGPTGTGKSALINKMLCKTLPQEIYRMIKVGFTARTEAGAAQDIIDGCLGKRKRGVYGPPFGCKAVLFIDDINMPEIEEYGAQPPVELMRQFCDQNGWYDNKEKSFRKMIDCQLIAAMLPPGGSNNHITPRMMRWFSVICIDEYKKDAMTTIFSAIVNWHMKVSKMPNEVTKHTNGLVEACVDIYEASCANLRPTPVKSHYMFNLRDLARITQGLLALKPYDDMNVATILPKLYLHEVTRVIGDRLVNDEDKQWLLNACGEIIERCFTGHTLDKIIGPLNPTGVQVASLDAQRCLFFGCYTDLGSQKPTYKEVLDAQALIPLFEQYLENYNTMSKTPMDLVLFVFAIEHVSRVCRVLAMPGGHSLLVGVGGSGRQSLSRLATFVLDYDIKQIALSKNYTMVEWRDDLRIVLKKAGIGSKPFVFLFSDTQIKYADFVLDINSILNTGQVPNLFGADDKAEIIDGMRVHAKNLPNGRGKNMSSEELWEYYLERCQQNLHVLLAFSPIGSAFRDRLRAFPSLINCTTIDWFFQWPTDALEAVAAKFLLPIEMDDNVKSQIIVSCSYLHNSVRTLAAKFEDKVKRVTYTTPTSYLELLRSYQSSLDVCREQVGLMKDRYANGLDKLDFAAEQVATMQQELTDLLPVLADSQVKTNELMETIQKKLPGVQEMQKTVGQEAAVVQVEADKCNAMKSECEADLAEAIPLLESALKALDTLKSSDITEVKAMKTPPAGVVLTMTAVCIMMKVKSEKIKDPNDPNKKIADFWGPAKKHLLGDSKFLSNLKVYDKDNIDPKIMAKIRKTYIDDPGFQPDIVKKASVAAMGLCQWVRAMEAYDRVAKVVAPKKAKLAESEAQLKITLEALGIKKAELKKVEDDLAALEANLAEAQNRKADLEANVELCNDKLVRAQELLDGLGGEKSRWGASVERLSDEYLQVTGNVLVSAGLMAYLGPFTSEFRSDIIKDWVTVCKERKIPCADSPSLVRTLGDPVAIRQWQLEGLPADAISTDNAITVFNSRRWPLMIDPQGQANKWIRNMEKANSLKTIKFTDDNYMRTVENAVQFGSPVLLENVLEELDPTLEPLLQKLTFKQGGVLCIRLGDNTVEYSEDFRFYMTTKLTNPHYLPEVAVKVTLLNFMITPAGLRDQLLTIVVVEERPDLAAEKNRLIVEGAENAKKLKECEDNILAILSSAEGNILENADAIKALKDSKEISNDIEEKQRITVETEVKIDEVRAKYVPVAVRGQILYFNVSDLALIEPTYQYSLEWFSALFVKGIRQSEKSRDLSKRLENLSHFFTYSLYCNICRSLLEKDKLLFSFLTTVRIAQGNAAIDYAEWYFLLTGGMVVENKHRNPAKDWLSDKSWGELCRLSELSAFSGLRISVAGEPDLWKVIYDSDDAESEPLPSDWNEKLDNFKKLLVLRCIRPDKLELAIQNFIVYSMGEKYVMPPPFNLPACFDESAPLSPLVFVLSAGADPMTNLLKLASDMKMQVDSVSLGQGQGPKAEKLMDDGKKNGTWVCLQNAHLASSWLPSLERVCEQTTAEECHNDYRLWITTYPSNEFPVSILQNAVKITLEPPKGMRANILGSYTNDPICDPAFFNSVKREVIFRRMLYSLCFFHANIQERKEFGALGWNNAYEFNNSDLLISIKQLAMFLDLYEEIPFKALNYCFGSCNYGGRVTDDKDNRTLDAILKDFFCPEMLEDDHKITKSGSYIMPPDGNYQSYIAFIQTLPLTTKPEVFGLHQNASITKDQKGTRTLLASVLITEASRGGGGDDDDDDDEDNEKKVKKTQLELTYEIASIQLEKIPPLYDMEYAKLKYPVKWDNSMNTVLNQELERFNALSAVISQSLQDTMDGIKGVIVMSADLEKAGKSLFYGKVPDKWLDASYPSLKPLSSYVSDFLQKLQFLKLWLDGKSPPAYWISGFYFTQAFLTGTLQNHARRYTIPIDDVHFDFEMMPRSWETYRKPPKDGCYIYGLFLDGARWNGETKLLDSSHPKVLFSEAPTIWLKPAASSELKVFDHYVCPTYKTSQRYGMLSTTGHSTNFVMYLKIPSKPNSSDDWIKGGVAALTQLDD